jgi:hypothetical protein
VNEPSAAGRHCIICLSADGPFTSREHIISEALGNVDLILPVGVVCDRCNNGVCARLDKALIDFPVIQLMRVVHGLPSKAGKLPRANFSNGTLVAHGEGQITVENASKAFIKDTSPTTFVFQLQMANLTAPKLELISRALLKLGIECAYMDHGYNVLVSSEWDDVRTALRVGGDSGYVAIPTHVKPAGDVSISYWPGKPSRNGYRLAVRLSAFGISILTVLGHQLPTAHFDQLAFVHSFPEPAKAPTMWLNVEVNHSGKTQLPSDHPSIPGRGG